MCCVHSTSPYSEDSKRHRDVPAEEREHEAVWKWKNLVMQQIPSLASMGGQGARFCPELHTPRFTRLEEAWPGARYKETWVAGKNLLHIRMP